MKAMKAMKAVRVSLMDYRCLLLVMCMCVYSSCIHSIQHELFIDAGTCVHSTFRHVEICIHVVCCLFKYSKFIHTATHTKLFENI